MKKKPPQSSSLLKLGEVFARLLKRLPLRGAALEGKPLRDRRLLLFFVLLVGASLFLLRGGLTGPTEPERQPPPPVSYTHLTLPTKERV